VTTTRPRLCIDGPSAGQVHSGPRLNAVQAPADALRRSGAVVTVIDYHPCTVTVGTRTFRLWSTSPHPVRLDVALAALIDADGDRVRACEETHAAAATQAS
jgi:hypothetical protein